MASFFQFNDGQLKFIAEVLGNVGIAFFISMVLPILSGSQDIYFVLSGALSSFICWILGLVILAKIKRKENQ